MFISANLVVKWKFKIVNQVLLNFTASVAELKKNSMGTVASGEGAHVAILNRNTPYSTVSLPPAEEYHAMVERLEEAELNALADEREAGPFVQVELSEL